MSELWAQVSKMTELEFINRPITIKNPPDFTVVSTFAGGGGSSTGYVWAGGKVLLAVEWDDNAVETYRLNYPNTDIYHGDIAKLTVDEVLKRTGLSVGELDIFDGSPPCQGFSTAGKRLIDDPRNQLFREYVRLLRGLKPKVFVMENVSGMVKGKMKLLFADILKELRASGYVVSAKLLNAMYLGVPQSRERMIFIGVRKDLGIAPSHPKPQTIIIALSEIIEDAIGSQSQQINPVIPSTKACCTIAKQTRNKILHTLAGQRNPTIKELKIIGSFPDKYLLTGDFSTQWARIGNSVPPEMMRRVAEHIKREILENFES